MPAKFTLTKTAGGKYHFSLLASNGSVIASSQPYATKASALNGLESFRKTAQSAAVSDFTNSSRVPAAKPRTTGTAKSAAKPRTTAKSRTAAKPAAKPAAKRPPAKRARGR